MWTPITLEMMQQVEEIRHNAGKYSSYHSFALIFIWKEEMQLSIWLEPDGYMVREQDRGDYCYFFPCGSDETKKKMLSTLPANTILRFADAQDLAFLEKWQPGLYKSQPVRDDWEYLYNKQAQLELKTKQYRQIRRSVNQFCSLANWRSLPLDAQSMPFAYEIEAQWQSLNIGRIGEADKVAAIHALDFFPELELAGVVVFLEDIPIGYALGCFLCPKTFCGIIQRAITPACFSALRWELYNMLPEQVHTLNLEDDMGHEGMRNNKMLMRPDGFEIMYDVTQPTLEEIT